MKPIQDIGQRQVYECIVRFRLAWGVSPTMREIGDHLGKPPVSKATILWRVHKLGELGFLTNIAKGEDGQGEARCWVPTFESRLLERWPEVVRHLRTLGGEDAVASELLEYADAASV